jgi:hypothetical protein
VKTSGELWLSTAYMEDNDLAASKAAGGRPVRDAVVVEESPTSKRYAFAYATVRFEVTPYETVREAVAAIRAFEAHHGDGKQRTVVLLPDGGPDRTDATVQIMMAEGDGGKVGATEVEAVYATFLDFGEHSVAISPGGVVIAGNVPDEDLLVYLYYVAQLQAALCRYAKNEGELRTFMEDLHGRAKTLGIEALHALNESTAKAMLDISDEFLDIPPRERFILRALLATGQVAVYEERIARMMTIVEHHVQHRHYTDSERNSRRIEFVLFVIAILGALAGLSDIFGTGTSVAHSLALAFLLVCASVGITVAASWWFYMTTTQRRY